MTGPITFHPALFPGTVTFAPPALPSELHGDPVILGASGSASYPAYVESSSRGGNRSEAHRQPEGAAAWSVFTPANPAAGVDWLCAWNGRLLRVIGPSATADGWNLWRTDCIEVI